MDLRRACAIADAGLRLIASALFASMLATALHDASQAWDVGYYHLPFAARLAGIVREDAFVFHAANRARFDGFPLLAERAQGLLWRVTGRAECVNLVALASVPLVAWVLRRRLGVPVHLAVLGLLAIPLVHTHATSAYVDLPANAAMSVAALLAIEAWASPDRPRAPTLILGGIAGAIAANTKALLHPLVLLAVLAILARALPFVARDLRDRARRTRALATLGAIAVALPIVFATPLANLAAHGNPYYPVRTSVLGHALPGVEGAYASSPPWLADAPRPVRFACSLLEIGVRPMTDPRRWSVDQWMPDDSTGNRMGGFFGAYVVLHLALFGWQIARDRSRRAGAAAIGFGALTMAVAWMPQSHELRYYLCWMIVLVSLNLWLASAEDATSRAIGVVSVAALTVVLCVTRAAYALPLGSTFETLAREKVDARVLEGVRDGERICVRREPWNLLWAAPFHPPRRYTVEEAERADECSPGSRSIDP